MQLAGTTIFIIAIGVIESKTIDNKLTGTPEVGCGPERIKITGETEEQFEGVIFVKNWRRTNGCAISYAIGDNSTTPSFAIALNKIAQCGLEMRRNPETKELEIFGVFVFSFHPSFVTSGDRSFAVHCIFLQQQLQVATKFGFIADITTRGIIGATANLPTVKLTIVEGRVPDPTFEPAKLVSVGDQLMYIWYLDLHSEIYGIRINECFAESKDGRKIQIIQNGCSLDPIIMSHIQYSENNLKAFSDGLAFKFPDTEDIWLVCAVATCIRKFEHLQLTSNHTQHLCQKQTACTKRKKRSSDTIGEVFPIYTSSDLVDHRLRVIDVAPHSLPYTGPKDVPSPVSTEVCLNRNVFAGTYAAIATTYLAVMSLAGSLGVSIYRAGHRGKLIP